MGFGKFLLKATKGLSLILGNENGGNDLGKKAAAIIIGIVIGVIVTIVAVMDYILSNPLEALKNFFFGEDLKTVEEYKNDEALNNSFGRTNFKYEDLIIEHNFANEAVKALIEEGKKHLGKPYVWAAVGPECFDCSGYVAYCLRKSGVRDVPVRPTCRSIWSDDIIQIKTNEARTGDLVFFSGTQEGISGATHIGIMIGGGNFLEANSDKGVVVSSLDTNWAKSHLYGFGRIKSIARAGGYEENPDTTENQKLPEISSGETEKKSEEKKQGKKSKKKPEKKTEKKPKSERKKKGKNKK